jgi:UDP-N-acetyl-D-mannosaminuronate dehydrogenase
MEDKMYSQENRTKYRYDIDQIRTNQELDLIAKIDRAKRNVMLLRQNISKIKDQILRKRYETRLIQESEMALNLVSDLKELRRNSENLIAS